MGEVIVNSVTIAILVVFAIIAVMLIWSCILMTRTRLRWKRWTERDDRAVELHRKRWEHLP